ncbi:CPBP family intramembrane metalloprotease [candidate division WOR-3 bacterium]|nr:CPBP family intramembrane metalloprotease [candidate division WOR-3 bacterium]
MHEVSCDNRNGQIARRLNPGLRITLVSAIVLALTFNNWLFMRIPLGFYWTIGIWSALMLGIHLAYTHVVKKEPVFSDYRIRVRSAPAIILIVGAAIIGSLSLIFPQPEATRLDVLSALSFGIIGEEALFRGIIWDMLERWVTGKRRFIALSLTGWATAVLFSLAHLQYHDFRIDIWVAIQLGQTFIAGIILGAVRERTSSVTWSLILHSAGNGFCNMAGWLFYYLGITNAQLF